MKQQLIFSTLLFTSVSFAQTIDKSYLDYDFQAGETTLFEDRFLYSINEKLTDHWTFLDGGGAASIKDQSGEKILSFDAFYTRLQPKFFTGKSLPDDFTIEYDTWLDASYDGNPGVVIVFETENGNREISVTPNKHQMGVTLPNNESVSKDNPEPYFGENQFYNRWVHVSISVHKKQMKVYLDQYKMLEIADLLQQPKQVIVYGDKSGEASDGLNPIYMKNFRIANGFPAKIEFVNDRFVTHNIKFDVNKYNLKPESITVIKQVKAYLDAHPEAKLEIGGHTDGDGADDFNLKLSQQRADAVKNQLISLGIAESRLSTSGYGESNPIDQRPTAEGKANNRCVEFLLKK